MVKRHGRLRKLGSNGIQIKNGVDEAVTWLAGVDAGGQATKWQHGHPEGTKATLGRLLAPSLPLLGKWVRQVESDEERRRKARRIRGKSRKTCRGGVYARSR